MGVFLPALPEIDPEYLFAVYLFQRFLSEFRMVLRINTCGGTGASAPSFMASPTKMAKSPRTSENVPTTVMRIMVLMAGT